MTTSNKEQVVVDTGLFGDLVVERTENSVSTWFESDDATKATIERTGPRTRKNVPIGSRDAGSLSLRVGARELGLTLGSGRLLKRTYRVVVETDGRFLSMRPNDIESCYFLDGKPHEIEKEFGELSARTDGTIEVTWALPKTVKILNKTVEPPVPTAEDLLIGYVLAAAFGTSALSLTTILMGAVGSVLPG
ncbi:hypothetical protein [Nocardia sp. NPDC003963]